MSKEEDVARELMGDVAMRLGMGSLFPNWWRCPSCQHMYKTQSDLGSTVRCTFCKQNYVLVRRFKEQRDE